MEASLCSVEEIGRALEPLHEFWDHWGFEPWAEGPFAGVARRQRFVKDGFLGTIAEYMAWDCIAWRAGTHEEREALWRSIKPLPEIMTQRFLFLVDEPWTKRRVQSFSWGFKGYAEFYAYRPSPEGGIGGTGVKDLADLVDMGVRFSETGRAAKAEVEQAM
ncbi:MAG: hypothetical protein DELT_01140 [Desulfovibrio sp.]